MRLTDVFSNYQNLGPLPPVPVESLEWSRRQSAVSGIYEEIPEAEAIAVAPRREKEPAERNNGIYERLYRRRSNTVTQSLLARTPPPLPPRQRINTLDREEGSATSSLVSSPDSDTLKKRKYKTVLESIFGKPSTSSSVGSRKGSESSSTDVDEVRARFNSDLLSHLETNLGKSKRNSFSTPELANWDEEGEGGLLNRLQENENEEEDATEWQDISCTSLLSESMDISLELNISDKIKPNFNLSMNTSTINLVGCNFNAIRESEMGLRADGGPDEKRQSLHQLNGYCVMKPIPSTSEEEGVVSQEIPIKTSGAPLMIMKEDEKSAGYCQMGAMGFDREQLRKLDQPVRGIVFNEDARVKLLDMKNITMTRGSECDEEVADEESFLRRKANPTPPRNSNRETTSKDEDLYENCKENRNSRGSKYLVDDKIPSYFPNESPPNGTALITPPKLVPKQRSRASMTPSPRLQNYSPRAVPNIYSVPRNNSPVLMDNAKDTEMLKQSLTDSISKLSLISNSPQSNSGFSTPVKSDGGTNGSPQKTPGTTPDKKSFDTIQSPNKYLDKCSLKADFANLKRFASLPRFRKLGLSPLRIKLNSVLHRHNSEF